MSGYGVDLRPLAALLVMGSLAFGFLAGAFYSVERTKVHLVRDNCAATCAPRSAIVTPNDQCVCFDAKVGP